MIKGRGRSRLVRTLVQNTPRWGVVEKGIVYELDGSPFAEWVPSTNLGGLDSLQLLAPAAPSKIVCVGRNYSAHAAEHGAEVPAAPLLFLKPPSSVVGPGAPVILPPQSAQVEHESELAVVMGRRCRDVSPDEAWEYVVGVTCGNDVSARDLQVRDGQWTRAKGFDTFCPLGPWLVSGLTERDVSDLAIACRVNGELRQSGRTSEMVFSAPYIISYASSVMTLLPGDVVMTGTPAGVSPLTSGDIVEVEVEGIGTLRNPVTG